METENREVFGEKGNSSAEVIADGKTIAILAYITLIGLVAAFIMNNEKKNTFAKYHIRQALGIGLTGFALGMIGIVPILGWFIAIVGFFILFAMWIMGLMSALNGTEKPVFLLGEKYQEWFKDI